MMLLPPGKPFPGSQIKKEMNACSVAHDLPQGNHLRDELLRLKSGLEKRMDKFFGYCSMPFCFDSYYQKMPPVFHIECGKIIQ